MADLYQLNAHSNMSVEDAISYVSRENLDEILIIGYNDQKELIIRSSKMSREHALWILELAKKHTLSE